MKNRLTNLFIAIFAIFVLSGCSEPLRNQIVGIDVSASAKTHFSQFSEELYNASLNPNVERMIFYIFSYDAFEIYSGPRPTKDRDISELINSSIDKSKELDKTEGTDFVKMLRFVSKRILPHTYLNLYTDGYFENSQVNEAEIKKLLQEMKANGLVKVKIIGVDIKNKEKIYGWFESSGVQIIYD